MKTAAANYPTDNHWQEQKSAVILGIGNPLLDISAEVSQELKSHLFFSERFAADREVKTDIILVYFSIL